MVVKKPGSAGLLFCYLVAPDPTEREALLAHFLLDAVLPHRKPTDDERPAAAMKILCEYRETCNVRAPRQILGYPKKQI
jgi:hypothetical protein